MQKINGEWIHATYSLPKDASFSIESYRGSYSLKYYRSDASRNEKSSGTIREGIIDYRINNR